MAPRSRSRDVDRAESVRMINGLKVLKDDPVLSSLPGKPPLGMRLLTLEDNSEVYTCADCSAVMSSRGKMQRHRSCEHPSARSRSRNRQSESSDFSIPPEMAAMPLGELLVLAKEVARWGDLFDLQESQLEGWKARALTAEQQLRRVTVALNKAGFALKVDE